VIDRYDFGTLQLDGKKYYRDVVIYPNGKHRIPRVESDWWRKEGHRLNKADLDGVLRAKPEVLVVGTGYHSCMKLSKEVMEVLKEAKIEVQVAPTKEACQLYNKLKDVKKVAAVLHLAC
jgi:hypothetical protein